MSRCKVNSRRPAVSACVCHIIGWHTGPAALQGHLHHRRLHRTPRHAVIDPMHLRSSQSRSCSPPRRARPSARWLSVARAAATQAAAKTDDNTSSAADQFHLVETVMQCSFFAKRKRQCWSMDWVRVLHPTWHKIGHFRDDPFPSQSLGLVRKN